MTKKAAPDPITQVELWSVSELVPNERNARVHDAEQIAQIRASIAEFGFTNPILVDELGTIVAGHGRHATVSEMYADGAQVRLPDGRVLPHGTVPVIVARGWSDEQRRAYTLADNVIALNATWDNDLLRLELGELRTDEFDIGLIGFGADELAKIFAEQNAGNGEPDEVPEPEAVAISTAGDIWVLGEHLIICGDSTDPETVAALLGSERPNLMVTDPPYGVEYDPNWRNEAARHSEGMGNRKIGAGAVGKVLNDDKADWTEAWKLFPGDVAYVWHGALHAPVVAGSLANAGFAIRSQIIWDKTRLIIGRGDYHWEHEPAWYAVRKGRPGGWNGDRKQTTVWRIPHQKSETGHGTQKPVECMKRPIENNSKPGDAVFEPFSGSGTTIIAGEMTGRRVFAAELNPVYVDVAVRRWQTFTGKVAVHAATGEAFDAVAARVAEAA